MKKLVSLILTIILTTSLFPASVLAEAQSDPQINIAEEQLEISDIAET